MSLHLSLLLSLALHLALIATPGLIRSRADAAERLSVRLIQPPQETAPTEFADEIATKKSEPLPAVTPTASPPRSPRRNSSPTVLRRAQQALAEHLLYPPEAIARGMEGEVILLLMLDPRGRILSAEVARSSGHVLLDEAARSAALRLGSLPGSPAQTLLPVGFRLQ